MVVPGEFVVFRENRRLTLRFFVERVLTQFKMNQHRDHDSLDSGTSDRDSCAARSRDKSVALC